MEGASQAWGSCNATAVPAPRRLRQGVCADGTRICAEACEPAASGACSVQNAMTASGPPSALKRELGVLSAAAVVLGSVISTGAFIGIAAGAAGPSVILVTAFAAIVAACNAPSSAQFAASHAVTGGTYEYGYRYRSPWLGFTAGWMFLCAKMASAATDELNFFGLSAPSGRRWLCDRRFGVDRQRRNHLGVRRVLDPYLLRDHQPCHASPPERGPLYPPVVAWCGPGVCLFLAIFVPSPIWLAGLTPIAGGLAWHLAAS